MLPLLTVKQDMMLNYPILTAHYPDITTPTLKKTKIQMTLEAIHGMQQ
jgi:hypothetical protein